MGALPKAVRSATPDRLRDSVLLRAVAVGSGLIPPRTLHSTDERELLQRLARGARRVVEVGVYEGASAAALCEVLGPEAELHLIDPFGHHPTALQPGWAGTEWASRRVVHRAARRAGPQIHWHVELSEVTGRGWSQPIELVFIDGDHAEDATRLDWELWHPHVVPGGHVLFHDALLDHPGGRGLPGPTTVVDELFRGDDALPGWTIAAEVDRTVAVRRVEA
jgi:predicted O-methyltransferase YrrM